VPPSVTLKVFSNFERFKTSSETRCQVISVFAFFVACFLRTSKLGLVGLVILVCPEVLQNVVGTEGKSVLEKGPIFTHVLLTLLDTNNRQASVYFVHDFSKINRLKLRKSVFLITTYS